MKSNFYKLLNFFVVFLVVFYFSAFFAFANTDSVIENLKREIEKYSKQVKNIEKEAKEYESKIHQVSEEKNTLANQVKSLEHDIYHINLNIKKTESEIKETQLNIDLLNEEIKERGDSIEDLRLQMRQILQLIYESNKSNLFSIMLSTRSFSSILNKKDYLTSLERDVSLNLQKLRELKEQLKEDKKQQEEKKSNLLALKESLSDQKKISRDKVSEKNQLLRETKNKESQYQKILASLNKKRKNIEKEMGSLERRLQEAIDRSKLPQGKGILKWPLDKIRLTQGYGMTKFAKTGAYGGNIHNGLDLGGATGTKIKAAGDGEVIGVGNNGRYAYGKWVAIRHNNGLITLYAHMSLQKVKKGQKVKAGQLVGYIGATGYVTGPHLHFTVYAPNSFGLRQSTVVKWLKIPFGAPLNPYNYLP